MNIQSVSFMGTYQNPRNYKTKSANPVKKSTNPKYKNPNTQDEFRSSRSKQNPQKNKVTHKRKKSLVPLPVKTFAAGVATVLLLNSGNSIGKATKDVVNVQFDGNPYTLIEIADQYGCDEDIIRQYNGIESDADINSLSSLKVPKEYNYLDDEIEKLQETLYSSKLSDEERKDTAEKVEALKNKKSMQEQVAKAYTDGKYIYYIINLTMDNGKDFYSGINVEKFKDLFDIKDGQIKTYNKLNYFWSKDTNFEEDKGYFDFTGHIFHTGDVVKISAKGVDTKNIDLEEFN